MFVFLKKQRPWSGIVVAALALLLAGPAATGQEEEKGKSPADGPATSKEEPAKEPDPFLVPDGTPEELLKYIEHLGSGRPSNDSAQTVAEFRTKTFRALLEASEKLLAAGPNPKQTKAAVRYKLIALQMLDRMGDLRATQKLGGFPSEVEKLKIDDKDLLRAVRTAQLMSRLRRARGMSAKDLAALLDEVKALVKDSPADEQAAALATSAAMLVENAGSKELAIQTYQDFGKLLAASKVEEIAARAVLLEGAARRLGLVGKPIFLEGTTVDGKPFRWSKYKGKVVLVDFWATWCAPCRAELANIETCYDAYHDRGFDVVGISVDGDRAALDKFLKEHAHPWTILHDNREAAEPMSVRFGVFAVPTMILVGADGDVISINARGEELGKHLRKLFGPPEVKKGQAIQKDADRNEKKPGDAKPASS